jgi:hypothetical protein
MAAKPLPFNPVKFCRGGAGFMLYFPINHLNVSRWGFDDSTARPVAG